MLPYIPNSQPPPANDNQADIEIWQDSALAGAVLVIPNTDSAMAFLAEFTDGCWHGNALGVEPRYLPPLLAALRDCGFTISATG